MVTFPQEFFDLWELAKELNSVSPCEAFAACDLRLGGPFDYLHNKYVCNDGCVQ